MMIKYIKNPEKWFKFLNNINFKNQKEEFKFGKLWKNIMMNKMHKGIIIKISN